MNRFFTFLRDRHALLYKVFVFAVSLVVITWLSPGEKRFSFKLTGIEGKEWRDESVKAPFDYPVLKPETELEKEKQEIRENFTPYFRFDSLIADEAEQNLASSMNELSPEDRVRILGAVDQIYMQGVRAVVNETGHGSEDEVLLVRGKVAVRQKLGIFLTPQEADSSLKNTLPGDLYARLVSNIKVYWPANVVYDSTLTNKALRQALDNVSYTRGVIHSGDVIVNRGEVVTSSVLNELVSLKQAYENQGLSSDNTWLPVIARVLLVAFCLFLLFQFLRLFRREILASDARLTFILLMVVLMVLMSYLPHWIDSVIIATLPFCILPVIMRAFYDTRIALFVHLIAVLIISITLPSGRFEFLFVQFLTGIAAIFSIVNMKNRSQLFYTVLIILGVYLLVNAALGILSEGDVMQLHRQDFINATIAAVLTLLAYPLIFVFEKLFGFVSDVTLMELADTNHPLLRELAEKAPGTFQHSMQVANLAEEAIRRIGGNALLIRAGAMYHDIGKGDMPMYFIENQTTGMNPHEELSFEESASIIISHVIRGVEKARKYKLPDIVIDFIRTHHGTTNTAYFLTLYKKNNPEDLVDEELFRYPGPIPYSRETAVLMMADTVEAASRSLQKYDSESIDLLVERLIDHQADQHQFDNSDITLKDITDIKKVFKRKLRSIYHVRVEYPA